MCPVFLSNLGLGKIFLSNFKYRDRTTIVGDILDSIKSEPKGKTKTSIMRAANLNFDQVNKYLDLLTFCDFVKAKCPLDGEELVRYRLTGKGLTFLRTYETWHLALETYHRQII